MQIENNLMADYLNSNGLCEWDEIKVIPASGKSYQFQLNRTCIDFVSDSLFDQVDSLSKRKISGMKNEKLHVQLILNESQSSVGSKLSRYHIKVIQGPAIRLNGHYVFDAIVERGDEVEIGFNRIKFLKMIDEELSDKFSQKYKKSFHSNLPILIYGETGVGKTSLAQEIHHESGRAGYFVHLNLAALSKNLIESELFGHIKGAFTGAIQDKKGVFRQADKGTLFLDEIDSLPIELQTKLLTFLDNYKVRPVGSLQEHIVDTRLIMATGRNLISLVEKKEMRKDFYFRVASGPTINLPSLRDNPEFIRDFCHSFEVLNDVVISQKLVQFYQSLPWPGNYRQLKAHLEQKQVLTKGRKFNFDEQDENLIEQSSHLLDIHEDFVSMKEMKSIYAKKVFYGCQQNYNQAANKLAISSKSLKTLLQDVCAL